MATQEEIIGFQNIIQYIGQNIGILAQDKNEQEKVREYGDALGKLSNILKGYVQRLQEQQQKQAQAQGGDPELQAKVQAELIKAQAKAQNTRDAHAQRTAQRQTQFEMKMAQEEQKHRMEMQRKLHETQVNDDATSIETAGELQRQRMKSFFPTEGGNGE